MSWDILLRVFEYALDVFLPRAVARINRALHKSSSAPCRRAAQNVLKMPEDKLVWVVGRRISVQTSRGK